MTTAIFLAAFLHVRSPQLIHAVYQVGGLDAVAVVACESTFYERAWRREPWGGTSWGLYQLYDRFHPQYRRDLILHIAYGQGFLFDCETRALDRLCLAIVYYNGSVVWGRVIENRRDQLRRWLAWRERKALECVR